MSRVSSSPRIFLSYARADGQAAADALRTLLANPSLTGNQPLAVWQDLTSMRSGQWREQIRSAIKTGDHLLMVLSPGALASEVCTWEWHVARLEGAEISPVLADPALALDALPSWMTAQHIYRLDPTAPGLAEHSEWQRLVASLRAAPTARRMPTISRTPGEHFVPRPTEMNALRDMLLDANGDAVGITTAFTGSGGMGKTTLALALAHDQAIQSAFYGGQLLVELGQITPNQQNSRLLILLNGAIRDLTGETSDAETVKQASEKLAAALADRRVLLVIDDVWNWLHLEPFMQGGPACARLVTTRDQGVLDRFRGNATPITVDQMSEDQAVALLGAGLPAADIAAHVALLTTLANRLGRCALLLELANGRIWTWARDRGGLSGALDEAEIEFRFKGVTAFDTEDRAPVDLSNPTSRNEAYADSIAASLALLLDEHKARFLELAIFPEDTDIPYASIALYWAETAAMDERATINRLDRLKRMSLVKGALLKDADPVTKAETPRPAIRLHDLIRSYAREPARTSKEALADLNRRFWKAHVDAGERAFAEGTALARYAYERLPWHLSEAGEREALDALLLEPGWMRGKISETDVRSLLTDYDQYAPADRSAQGLVRRALRLGAGSIGRDKRQLLPQLHGRLLGIETAEIARFVNNAHDLVPRPALVTQRPTLTPPGAQVARFEGHSSGVNALACLSGGRLASGSDDTTIRIWDLQSGSEITRLESIGGSVNALTALPDGRLAAARYCLIQLWDIATAAIIAQFEGLEGSVKALALLPDGRLASGGNDKIIRLWDVVRGAETGRLEGHSDAVNVLAVLPNGRLASGSEDKTIRIWDVNKGIETGRLDNERGQLGHVTSLIPVGDSFLAAGLTGGWIRLWDTNTYLEASQFRSDSLGINALCGVSNGFFASGDLRGMILIWDLNLEDWTVRFDAHSRRITALMKLPDGRLSSASVDKTIRLWDISLATAAPANALRRSVGALVQSPDGRLIIGQGGVGGLVHVWNTTRGLEEKRLGGERGVSVTSLAMLSINSVAAATAEGFGKNNRIVVWDLDSGEVIARCDGHAGRINAVVRLSDSRFVSCSSDGTIRIWDINSSTELARLETSKSQVNALALLPDGRLASASVDRIIKFWDINKGIETSRLVGHESPINALVLLPDGRLASGGNDKIIRLWDVVRGIETGRLEGHYDAVNVLAVLPNGLFAAVTGDKTIRVWDAAISCEIASLDVDQTVECLVALADGRLVAGDAHGRLHWLRVLL